MTSYSNNYVTYKRVTAFSSTSVKLIFHGDYGQFIYTGSGAL